MDKTVDSDLRPVEQPCQVCGHAVDYSGEDPYVGEGYEEDGKPIHCDCAYRRRIARLEDTLEAGKSVFADACDAATEILQRGGGWTDACEKRMRAVVEDYLDQVNGVLSKTASPEELAKIESRAARRIETLEQRVHDLEGYERVADGLAEAAENLTRRVRAFADGDKSPALVGALYSPNHKATEAEVEAYADMCSANDNLEAALAAYEQVKGGKELPVTSDQEAQDGE